MGYRWEPKEYESLASEIRQMRRCLQEWFLALEDGTAELRLPDPFYPVSISQEIADAIIAEFDKRFNKELESWARLEVAGGYEAGPDLMRLKPLQRIALVQDYHRIMAPYRNRKAQAERESLELARRQIAEQRERERRAAEQRDIEEPDEVPHREEAC